MKQLAILLLTILLTSCIPYKIAPKFKNEDYKVMNAKKFQRKLPRETSFIFKDPKDADEFYNYINTKYSLKHNNVGLNTPILIDNETFYLNYYEVERTDETANVGLLIADTVLEEKTGLTAFDENYTSRKGHWYIIITVYDNDIKNSLLDKHPKKAEVLKYLKALKQEYLTTHNYEELLFSTKS